MLAAATFVFLLGSGGSSLANGLNFLQQLLCLRCCRAVRICLQVFLQSTHSFWGVSQAEFGLRAHQMNRREVFGGVACGLVHILKGSAEFSLAYVSAGRFVISLPGVRS